MSSIDSGAVLENAAKSASVRAREVAAAMTMDFVNSVVLAGRVARVGGASVPPASSPNDFYFSIEVVFVEDSKEGNTRSETSYFRIMASGEIAQLCRQICKAGNFVEVEGKSITKTWQDNDGIASEHIIIVAHRIKAI